MRRHLFGRAGRLATAVLMALACGTAATAAPDTAAARVGNQAGSPRAGILAAVPSPAALLHWVMVERDLSNYGFWDSTYDARVGRDPEDSTTDRFRSYFQFDLKPFAGKQIKKAIVTFGEKWRYSCTPEPVYLWHTGVIGPSTTWRTAPPLTGAPLGSVLTPKDAASCNTFTNVEFDVKALVTQGAAAGWPDLTLALAGNEGYDSNGGKTFDTQVHKPFIDIEYNTIPTAPTQLSTGGVAGCSPTADAYVNTATPALAMRLEDADTGQQMRATIEWRKYGSTTSRTLDTPYGEPGKQQQVTVPAAEALAHGQRYEWRTRSSNEFPDNQVDYGPWSPWCVFTVDTVAPATIPSITANPPSGWLEDRPVTVTLAAPGDPDVHEFIYTYNGVSARVAATNGTASVPIVPAPSGGALTVSAVDRAGNVSTRSASLTVDVAALPAPAGSWQLDDAFGDAALDGSEGAHDARLSGGYEWISDGSNNGGLRFDGAADSHGATTGPVVNTNASFTVMAWVRLADTTDWRNALSQAGVTFAGFVLRYDAGCGCWVFAMRAADTDTATESIAQSGATAQVGVWTHLAGVYDHEAGQIRIYVNGRLTGSAPHRSTWNAQGSFGLGYANWHGLAQSRWKGDLDEVKAYRFAATERKIRLELPPDRWGPRAAWELDEGTGTLATDTSYQGNDAMVSPGATWLTPGRKEGSALRLDGVQGHAYTAGPVVRTNNSFTVAAWVRLNRIDSWFDAVSQDGAYDSGFSLKYSAYPRGWAFDMNPDDTAGANPTPAGAAVSNTRVQAGVWTHLAGVYDHAAKNLRIYVNGSLAGTAPYESRRDATGSLQIGRGKNNGFPVEWWPGDIDEVRVTDEALSQPRIAEWMSSDDRHGPRGQWNFDESTGSALLDATPGNGNTAVLVGGVTRVAGKRGGGLHFTGDPDGAGPVEGAYAYTAGPIVRTDLSFTAAAWVRLDRLDRNAAAVSQDGEWDSGFSLRYEAATRQWTFAMNTVDGGGNDPVAAIRSTATVRTGAWTHLAGTYDATKGELRLYVNGALAGTTQYRGTWNAARTLQIGKGRVNGNDDEWWFGDLDEVRMVDQALAAEQIRAMLVTTPLGPGGWWRLDEASGGSAVDSSGNGHPLALAGLTGWVPVGRCGAGLTFDGVSGRALTPQPVLATDDSFTVAAWVRLDKTGRVATAVSQDGATASAFRLGYASAGNTWWFALGGIGVTAPSGAPARTGVWTHVAATYDKTAKQVALYVNGQRVATATATAGVPATGSLRLGVGQSQGAVTEGWPGSVDEVRVLQRAATAAEIQEMNACDVLATPLPPAAGPIRLFAAQTGMCMDEDSVGSYFYQIADCLPYSELTLVELQPVTTYQITSLHYLRGAGCLEGGPSSSSGEAIWAFPCDSSRYQSWRFEPVDSPLRGYRLRVADSDQCMQIEGNSTRSHAQAIQLTCSPTAPGQVFVIDPKVVYQAPVFSDHVNVQIPDRGAMVERPIEVAGLTGNVPDELQVDVSIKHTCQDDLRITLVAPSGTTYRLEDSGYGNCDDDLVKSYWVHPNAQPANGTWKLQVQDAYLGDVGYLEAWSLTFVDMAF